MHIHITPYKNDAIETYLEQLTIRLSHKLQGMSILAPVGYHTIHQNKLPLIPMFPGSRNVWKWNLRNDKAKKINERRSKRTFGVPRTQSRIWSHAALAAENALDSLRALIIASPLCCTFVIKSVFSLNHYQYYQKKSKFQRWTCNHFTDLWVDGVVSVNLKQDILAKRGT